MTKTVITLDSTPAAPDCASWHGLRVYGLQLECPIPSGERFYGHHLRGVLGRALFDTVCLYARQGGHDTACAGCTLQTRCAYPQAFKPVAADRLPPYWLHGWHIVEDRLQYHWFMLEAALPHLEAWLYGLQRHWQQHQDGTLRVGNVGHDVPVFAGRTLRLDALTPISPPAIPSATCHLHTITPLISKHGGDPLYGPLRTRLQRLIQLYGDGTLLPIEQQPWVCSTVTQQPVTLNLPGRVWRGHHYRLHLSHITESARSLLQWGQYLHAGGHATAGCGAFRLVQD